jgi:hypothetical protein
MRDIRGAIDVDTLLKVILVLVLIWIALEIFETIVDTSLALLGPFRPLLGLVIVALIILWLLDKL